MAQMDYSPVVLRFIRSESALNTSGKEDHLLRIKRNAGDYFWAYSEANRKDVQYMEFQDGAAILGALERMFHILSWDEDPYESIQVTAPGYPMVLLKAKDIGRSWATLRPFLEGVFENWPLNTSWNIVKREDDDLANPEIDARDSGSEDSESEAEEGEVCDKSNCGCIDVLEDDEDEDDNKTDPDMPPLESQTETPLQELLRLMRQLDQNVTNAREGRWLNANTPENFPHNTNWLEAAEERQQREPITVRRIVNTPNGPRTHIRFI
jgi:hypothetical protein